MSSVLVLAVLLGLSQQEAYEHEFSLGEFHSYLSAAHFSRVQESVQVTDEDVILMQSWVAPKSQSVLSGSPSPRVLIFTGVRFLGYGWGDAFFQIVTDCHDSVRLLVSVHEDDREFPIRYWEDVQFHSRGDICLSGVLRDVFKLPDEGSISPEGFSRTFPVLLQRL